MILSVLAPGLDTEAATFPLNFLETLFGEGVEGATTTIEILLLLTVLTLVPSILILMTSFTRIVIILSFTRNAMGTQQMPPNQVIIGLALFLTYFTMYSTLSRIYDEAWAPYQAEQISLEEAYVNALDPIRTFMFTEIERHDHLDDLGTFMSLAGLERPESSLDEIPTYVLIPAFITSELKVALRMGFLIFLPFIVIDMIVASALMSMGMMMLPPAMISLPFKLMLFVLVNGWDWVVRGIVGSFG
ncbi:MAG: flagellar type III secretion system pore protein FliP [Oscillospiraceae bacterium]|jgi:flagellar biosynthetic protein FliP|nr:flagellar type III secretion system pore protein FliP [Oscillospiraceae bacterium]